MRLDLFIGWLQRCVGDFVHEHGGQDTEREPLEWLGLLFADASGLPDPVGEKVEQLLMVTASTRPGAGARDEEEEPGFCLGLRFCSVDDVKKVERLLVEQVRKRYALYAGMTPKEVRRALLFTVWAVPNPPKRGGWPRWLGPTGYYR